MARTPYTGSGKRPGSTVDRVEQLSPLIDGGLFIGSGEDAEEVTDEVEEILASLKIDPNALEEEASNHPSVFARIAILAEEASNEARWAKRHLDLLIADADFNLRRKREDGWKPTDKAVDREIEGDDSIIKARESLLSAERTAGILSALRQSLTHRKDMIIELMRDKRHEWQPGPGGGD